VLQVHLGATLVLAGDGPARQAAEARAEALGIAGSVRFLGYVSQGAVADLLAQSDLLALPSFAEGLPVVYMEALASRVPVVASRVAGVPELVQDGVTGFTVPPGDVDSLAERMTSLLSDPVRARAMGEAGRAVVEREFDIRTETLWLAEIFRNGGAGGRLRP
jgi:glycosyltransferase involved in cell wall biosynthesis